MFATLFSDTFGTSTGATYDTSGAIGTSTVWSVAPTASTDFGARIDGGILDLTNDASTATNVNGGVFAHFDNSAVVGWSSTLGSSASAVSWEFNMRQIRTDPAGFGSGSYGVAFILAGTTTNPSTGSGYAVVLGNSTSTDTVKLVSFTGGLATQTNIVAGTADIGNEYLSVKVTYTPGTNTWELFLRNDGATAFADPTTGTVPSIGTGVNSAFTSTQTKFTGGYWQGSIAANQTAFFDNVYLKSISAFTAPTVTTPTAINIADTTADLGGTVTANGGATVTSYGVVYSTTDTTPTIAEGATTVSTTGAISGAFTQSVSGLTPGSRYYYAAFATNSEGTSYSPVGQFDTTVPVNGNVPPTAQDQTQAIDEDTPFIGFASLNFGFSDGTDGDSLAAIIITALPTAGSLTLNGNAFTVPQEVTVANLVNLVYTPAANSTANAVFSFKVKDDGGTASGGSDTSTNANTFTFTINPINDPPSGTDNTVKTTVDSYFLFTAANFGYSDTADGAAAALFGGVRITSLPTGGTLSTNAGSVQVGDVISSTTISSRLLRFTPSGIGTSTFNFAVQEVTTGVEDPTPNTMTINVTASTQLTAGDIAFTGFRSTDPDGLSFVLLKDVVAGTTLTFTDNAWNGTALKTNEGTDVLTFGANFTAGTQFDFDFSRTAGSRWMTGGSAANLSDVLSGFSFAAGGDNVFAYYGANAPTTTDDTLWISVFSTQAFVSTGDPSTSQTFRPDALSTGSNSFVLGATNGALLTPSTISGSQAAVRGAIYTVTNWSTSTPAIPPAITFTVTAGATPTDIAISPASVPENVSSGTTVGTFSTTDADVGDTFTYSLVSGTGSTDNGAFTIDNTGNVGTLKTNAAINFETKTFYSIRVRSTDSFGQFFEEAFTINVVDVNEAPSFDIGGNQTNAEDDGAISVPGFATNILTGDGVQGLDFQLTADNTSLFTVQPDIDPLTGALTYTLAPNAFGSALISVVLVDDGGTALGGSNTSTTKSFLITATAVNDVPFAAEKRVFTEEDVPFTFSQNDFPFLDIEGDSLVSITISGLTLNGGTLKLLGTDVSEGQTIAAGDISNLVYSPPLNANGVDFATFNFTANDAGLGTVSAAIRVDVTAVNDVPVALNNTVTTLEDQAYTFAASNFVFTDVENDALVSIKITSLNLNGGTLKLAGSTVSAGDVISAANISTLVYTPAPNVNGTASFQFTANDADLGTTAATLTISISAVNDVPVATGSTVTTNEDTSYIFSSADFPYTDVENDAAVSITIGSLNLGAGSLLYLGTPVVPTQTILLADLGNLVFAPATNDFGVGAASFTYTANDAGAGTVPGTVSININNVNDPPVAINSSITTLEDVPYTFAASEFLFSDVDGNPLVSITISNFALNGGTLTLGGNTVSDGQIIPAAAISTLVYTPPANLSGPGFAGFSFTVNDGTASSAPAAMSINVTAANDAAIATGRTVTTNEDTSYSFSLADFPFTDAEGDALVSVKLSNLSLGGGTLLLNSSPVTSGQTILRAEIATLVYTPASNASGPNIASFSYTVNDGTTLGTVSAAVQVNVTAVNDVPVATNNSVTIAEDGSKTFAATDFTFTDVENNALVSVTVSNLSLGGGTLRLNGTPVVSGQTISATDLAGLIFTPPANASGSPLASFDFKVNDADLGTQSATLTVIVTAVNDGPVANPNSVTTNEDVPYTFSATDFPFTDIENNSLVSLTVSGLNLAGGTLNLAGVPVTNGQVIPAANLSTLVYTPASNQFGTALASFTFAVNDSSPGANTALLTINVTAVNDAPSFAIGPNRVVNEDSGAQTFAGQATAISTGAANEAQTLTFTVVASNPSLFSVQPAISSTGVLTFTPAPNAFTTTPTTITVTLSDGVVSTASQTFTITLSAVNDAPSFVKGGDQTVAEDAGQQTVTGWATNISKGPANESGQVLNFIVSTSNDGLFAVLPTVDTTTGTLTYTPAANVSGSATVTVTLQDNGGGSNTSASQQFAINVTPVNDPPSFTLIANPNQSVDANSGAKSVANFATNISSGAGENDSLTFTVTSNNTALFSVQPAISATGTLTYTLASGQTGTANLSVTLSDGTTSTASQPFTITVNSVAVPPTAAVSGPAVTVPGLAATYTLNVTSPVSPTAVYTFTISWGDGSAPQTVTGISGTKVTHTYLALGNKTLSVTAKDINNLTSAPANQAVAVNRTSIVGKIVYVGGTTGADNFTLTPVSSTGNAIRVKLGALILGNFGGASKIVVFGLAGNDKISIASATVGTRTVAPNIPVQFLGAEGNDTLSAATSRARVTLIGGVGNDVITGSTTRDILIGGAGNDTIKGGGGDDLIVAGSTSYDADLAALDLLMATWNSSASYSSRIATLSVGTTSLNATTVRDDKIIETIAGEVGRDWFLASTVGTKKDVVKDQVKSSPNPSLIETLTPIT